MRGGYSGKGDLGRTDEGDTKTSVKPDDAHRSTQSGQITVADDKKAERQQERTPGGPSPFPQGQIRFKS